VLCVLCVVFVCTNLCLLVVVVGSGVVLLAGGGGRSARVGSRGAAQIASLQKRTHREATATQQQPHTAVSSRANMQPCHAQRRPYPEYKIDKNHPCTSVSHGVCGCVFEELTSLSVISSC
jgi:hypothetical protein